MAESPQRAMILAAGLGTRLRPLTYVRPKVLTPLGGVRVLDYWIQRLHEAGVEAVIVNGYHLGSQLREYVQTSPWPIRVEVRVEEKILGTGGGLRNVLDFFQDSPLLVINGDILCDVDFQALTAAHKAQAGGMTFLMHHCPMFNNVAVSMEGQILGFGKRAFQLAEQNPKITLEAFTGIHLVDGDLLRRIPKGECFEILRLYDELIAEGRGPHAFHQPGLYWREMGSVEAYRSLIRELTRLPSGILPPLITGKPVWVHPTARVADDVALKGVVMIGSGSRVGKGVELQDTILWDDVFVEEGTLLRDCIVADCSVVSGIHEREVIAGGRSCP